MKRTSTEDAELIAKKPKYDSENPILLEELARIIFSFLNLEERVKYRRVCQVFEHVFDVLDRKPFHDLFHRVNSKTNFPLEEPGAPEEEIRRFETNFNVKLPFHLREFLRISNGRASYSSTPHAMCGIGPIEDWRFSSIHTKSKKCVNCSTILYLNLETMEFTTTDLVVKFVNFGRIQDWLNKLDVSKPLKKLEMDISDMRNCSSKEQALKLVEEKKFNYEFLPYTYRSDIDVATKYAEKYKEFAKIPPCLRSNKEFMMKYAKSGYIGTVSLCRSLLSDEEIFFTILSDNNNMKSSPVSEELANVNFAKRIVQYDGSLLSIFKYYPRIVGDVDIALEAIKGDFKALKLWILTLNKMKIFENESKRL